MFRVFNFFDDYKKFLTAEISRIRYFDFPSQERHDRHYSNFPLWDSHQQAEGSHAKLPSLSVQCAHFPCI